MPDANYVVQVTHEGGGPLIAAVDPTSRTTTQFVVQFRSYTGTNYTSSTLSDANYVDVTVWESSGALAACAWIQLG